VFVHLNSEASHYAVIRRDCAVKQRVRDLGQPVWSIDYRSGSFEEARMRDEFAGPVGRKREKRARYAECSGGDVSVDTRSDERVGACDRCGQLLEIERSVDDDGARHLPSQTLSAEVVSVAPTQWDENNFQIGPTTEECLQRAGDLLFERRTRE
jgi:hypothetical protein